MHLWRSAGLIYRHPSAAILEVCILTQENGEFGVDIEQNGKKSTTMGEKRDFQIETGYAEVAKAKALIQELEGG
jgi:hypothetical protein